MPETGAGPAALSLVPLPWGDGDDFWRATADGRLMVQRCVDTGRLLFPPVPRSPWGARRPAEWVTVSGRGCVWSFIVPHTPLIGQFAEVTPYVTVVVELAEDPQCRLVGPLVASAGAELGTVEGRHVWIGQPVVADLSPHRATDFVVPKWIPVASE